jgi:hypothetical protein
LLAVSLMLIDLSLLLRTHPVSIDRNFSLYYFA